MKCNKCGTEMNKVFSFEKENLQKMGFTVDVDELDLNGEYQVIIKINK